MVVYAGCGVAGVDWVKAGVGCMIAILSLRGPGGA
jgi:hypothetical protein